LADDSSRKQSEVQTVAEDNVLQQVVEAVDAAFPGLKCLRCGNDKFFLFHDRSLAFKGRFTKVTEAEYASEASEMIDLICQRCGMVEKHLLPLVQKAKKPIPTD
jgi:hypothetical protein